MEVNPITFVISYLLEVMRLSEENLDVGVIEAISDAH